MFFLGAFSMVNNGMCQHVVDDIVPLMALFDHAIDGAPIGQATQIAVVDEHIDLQLTRKVLIALFGLLRIIAVDSIKLQPTFTTPLNSLVQQFALAHRPKNESVTILA